MPARANTRLTDARAHRRYTPPKPEDIRRIELSELLRYCDRNGLSTDQFDLLRSGETSTARDVNVFYAGDLALLKQPCVSVVGTREVSPDGRQRAARLTRELVGAGITVVSGLARGVDTVAHTTAIEFGGATVGVPGTPLDRASPADNALLQEEMYRRHLLLTPFASASRVYRSNFPTRNRLMAAVSDATVIVEASDRCRSGSGWNLAWRDLR